jgi:hypothetical protein
VFGRFLLAGLRMMCTQIKDNFSGSFTKTPCFTALSRDEGPQKAVEKVTLQSWKFITGMPLANGSVKYRNR